LGKDIDEGEEAQEIMIYKGKKIIQLKNRIQTDNQEKKKGNW